MGRLIAENPQRALELAVPAGERAGLPPEIVDLLEVPISAAGEFEMVVNCYLGGLRRPDDRPELERFVTIAERRYRGYTFGRRAEMQTKDRISLHGIAIDDALAFHPEPVRRLDVPGAIVAEAFGERRQFADEGELDEYIAALVDYEGAPGPGAGIAGGDVPVANSAWTEGAKRILYLRVRFADEEPDYEPVSLATAQSQQADVEEHFRVASYGKMTVTTVFPDMITLPQDKAAYVGQGLGLMMNDARALAITMGQAQGLDWDYNNYDFYTIVSDRGIGGYAGIAQVGGRKSHLQRGYTSLRTSGHEFGHNFGLSHAHFNYTSELNPRGSMPVDGLSVVEYGHRFSLMSAQSGSDMSHPLIPHFTVHEKWRLDWLTDADFSDITTGDQSGIMRIFQNDVEGASGQRAVRVPAGGALSKYWLSYRTAWARPNRSSDNDYLLNGIVFDWTGSGGGTSTLLDMTPYSDEGSSSGSDWTRDNSDKWDAPLIIGRTYTDPESLLSVTPTGRGGTAPDEYIDVYVHLASGSETTLVGENDLCRAVIPDAGTAAGTSWTEVGFDDSAWPFSGVSGVGYDEASTYNPYISVDVESAMNNQQETCYIRHPFEIDGGVDLSSILSLKLRMRYDDGFVAYINGVRVAAANAPGTPTWNSGATTTHSDSAAIGYVQFSADAALGALVNGSNVLAIHGLNRGAGSSDFLIQPTLAAVFSAADNSPPGVSLAASTLVAGVNQDVTFTASGSDPDGDTLAYAWDFDIGDSFAPEGLNSPVAVRRWGSAGLYSVTVTCSDRKGGLARDRVLVKVGSPSNEGVISGRVLRGGEGVPGARVSIAGTDTQSITLEDGSYLLAGLSTSSAITLNAMLDGEVFRAADAMPVTPSPDRSGVDFFGQISNLPTAPAQVISVSPHVSSGDTSLPYQFEASHWDNTLPADQLVPFGDTWSYLDTGVAPAAEWTAVEFDDGAWLSGVAELGYGDSQATTIGFGGSSSSKHITTWFRRSFMATDVDQISRLKLSLKRDDGARVFLNGSEIARDNLTSGTVSASTRANNDVSGASEEVLMLYAVDPSLLLEGENLIAVEVHQEAPDSSDLSFDLELSAARNLTEITPTWSVEPAGASISPEGLFSASSPGLYTVTATSGGISGSAAIQIGTGSDNLVTIEAPDGFLFENGGEPAMIRVTRAGATDDSLVVPLNISGAASPGSDFQTLVASATIPAGEASVEFPIDLIDDQEVEGRESIHLALVADELFSFGASAVATVTIVDDEHPVTVEPDAGPDALVFVDDSHQLDGQLLEADEFVSRGGYWKFDDTGSDLGSSWTGLAFPDSGWAEGLAEFGYGDGDEASVVEFGGNSSSKHITTYFRRHFFLVDPNDYSALRAAVMVDDGVVIYLNGTEVGRINMPAGSVGFSTRASSSVGGDDESSYTGLDLDPAALLAGENVLAVEVHQSSPSSSDLSFDMDLRGVTSVAGAASDSLWSVFSGPGSAIFGDDESPPTTVSFDEAGTYVLSLATAGGGASDEVTIAVNPVPEFSDWVAGFSLAAPGALDDPDGDEWSNLMEFATVSDPADGSNHALPELAGDPAAPTEFLFTYRRLRALDPAHASGSTGDGYSLYGIRYTVEASDGIDSWQAASELLTIAQEGAPTDNGDGSESVKVRLTPPLENDRSWFVRLSVTAE
ncbi:MAG: PKD domain-containing protein [Verrucomicrobiales bacterium]